MRPALPGINVGIARGHSPESLSPRRQNISISLFSVLCGNLCPVLYPLLGSTPPQLSFRIIPYIFKRGAELNPPLAIRHYSNSEAVPWFRTGTRTTRRFVKYPDSGATRYLYALVTPPGDSGRRRAISPLQRHHASPNELPNYVPIIKIKLEISRIN